MDALLMCGGRGTRLESSREKPLYPIAGEAMVDRVLDALEASRLETIRAVVSPNAPETRAHLEGYPRIETPGDGYVADLGVALERVETPVCTVVADLPLLAADAIDAVLSVYDRRCEETAETGGSLTVCVPVSLKRRLGVRCETTLERAGRDDLAPTGVNVVVDSNATEMRYVSDDPRLAVNVNRLSDARVAEALCE